MKNNNKRGRPPINNRLSTQVVNTQVHDIITRTGMLLGDMIDNWGVSNNRVKKLGTIFSKLVDLSYEVQELSEEDLITIRQVNNQHKLDKIFDDAMIEAGLKEPSDDEQSLTYMKFKLEEWMNLHPQNKQFINGLNGV